MQVLYKKTSKGQSQQWQIIVEGDSYYTIEGIVDGKLTTSLPTVCKPKNVGRANETTAEEQALKEAQSKYQKKLDAGYVEDVADIDNEAFTQPMTAKVYGDRKDRLTYPLWHQPKLDGMRCIVKKEGMFTRTGKPIISAPHIYEAWESYFVANPDLIVDGELYNHEYHDDFNKIISLAKKMKPTSEDLKESREKLQLHVYDIVDEDSVFSERFARLKQMVEEIQSDSICLTYTVAANNEEELDEQYADFVAQGYEGSIVRPDVPYQKRKKSDNLLKRKGFMDDEFTIIRIEEGAGNRAGTAARVFYDDGKGGEFKSNVKGSFEFMAQLLKDREELIGKKATVRFLNYTPDGVPRCGFLHAIRDYE